MPSNILTTDTSFPRLTEEQSTDEKFGVITNYLYMLLEQLRYSMANLGRENFNDAAFQEIAGIITDPVYLQLKNVEGDILSLQITAEGLSGRISDAEGHITSLQVTAQDLTVRMKDAEGNVSSLQQTAATLTSQITDAENNISSLQQTATTLTSQIKDAEDNISTLQQTATSLTSRVKDTEGNVSGLQQTAATLTSQITDAENSISMLRQTVNSITLSVSNGSDSSAISLYKDGVAVSSQKISFTGMVTFTDLETDGMTTINGGNISTGTIRAIDIEGCTFISILESNGRIGGEMQFWYRSGSTNYIAGGIRLDDQGAGSTYENQYRMFVYTYSAAGRSFALKLQAAGGISMESNANIYLEAYDDIVLDGNYLSFRTGDASIAISGENISLTGNVSVNGTPLGA